MLLQGGERVAGAAGRGRGGERGTGLDDVAADGRSVARLDEREVIAPRAQQVDRRVVVAGLHGPRELGDRAAEAPDMVERDDAVDDPVGQLQRAQSLVEAGSAWPGARARSPSTAPASTDASWSGSPTSTSRACGRTASSRRAIIVSDTIDVSSTTTTSNGSRWSRP